MGTPDLSRASGRKKRGDLEALIMHGIEGWRQDGPAAQLAAQTPN